MDASLLAAVFGIAVLAVFVWWLVALIEALKTPSSQWQAAGQSQILYVVLMVLLGVIGTILYVAVARPALRNAGPAA